MKRSLLVPFTFLALFGAGCFSKQTLPATHTTSTARTAPVEKPYLPPPTTISTEEQYLAIVKAAVNKFRDAKTFRASLSAGNASEQTTGDIAVMKPDRFKGTIQLPGEARASNIIAIGQSLYVQVPDAGWVVFNDPSTSAALRRAFNAGLSGNGSLSEDRFPKGTVFTKTADASKNCDRYSTTLLEEGKNLDISLCIRNGFPVHVETSYDLMTISVDYKDFNSLFTIERPIIPKNRL